MSLKTRKGLDWTAKFGAIASAAAELPDGRAVVAAGPAGCARLKPLVWTQVKSDLDPMRFTLRTVPALIRRSQAWSDYCASDRPLENAIKRLGKTRITA